MRVQILLVALLAIVISENAEAIRCETGAIMKDCNYCMCDMDLKLIISCTGFTCEVSPSCLDHDGEDTMGCYCEGGHRWCERHPK